MKASPNREQFLFLVTGGIILVLILLVVIFNMVRTPGDLITEKETQPAPKVKVGDRTAEANKSAWLTQVAPAPIFNADGEAKKEDSKVEIDAKDLSAPDNAPKEPAKTQEAWSPKDASALESARLDSRPMPREGGLNPARTPLAPPGDSHAGRPPLPKMGNESGSRAAPPQPSAQDHADHASDQTTAPGAAPKRQPKGAQKPAPEETEEPEEPTEGDKTAQKTNTAPPNAFSVQVASFNDTEHSTALANKLSNLMFDGKRMPVFQITPKVGKKTVYRVRLGPFPTMARAQQAANLAATKAGVKGTVLGPNQ
ncbi:MAG: SPOR domain-containing protein [Magnetococcales bacterium]|nr:SPOR domain-containing protein [Magnetococcales bacterium]